MFSCSGTHSAGRWQTKQTCQPNGMKKSIELLKASPAWHLMPVCHPRCGELGAGVAAFAGDSGAASNLGKKLGPSTIPKQKVENYLQEDSQRICNCYCQKLAGDRSGPRKMGKKAGRQQQNRCGMDQGTKKMMGKKTLHPKYRGKGRGCEWFSGAAGRQVMMIDGPHESS